PPELIICGAGGGTRDDKAARHHPGWRGGTVSACCSSAAAGGAGDRISRLWSRTGVGEPCGGVAHGPARTRLRRGDQYPNRVPVGGNGGAAARDGGRTGQ